jgi:hypothetical protein
MLDMKGKVIEEMICGFFMLGAERENRRANKASFVKVIPSKSVILN